MKILFCTLMMLSIGAVAADPAKAKEKSGTKEKAHVHREEKAHQHGVAKIEIAFQGTDGEISIDAAAEGIYGFEYVPKTEEDKMAQHNAFALVETNISDMVQFNSDLKCEISKKKMEVKQEAGEKHADFEALFKVICQKSPVGSTVIFNIQKTLPKLKEVKIDIIADEVQKSAKANKDGAKLVLKK